jgi:hypothetical protein
MLLIILKQKEQAFFRVPLPHLHSHQIFRISVARLYACQEEKCVDNVLISISRSIFIMLPIYCHVTRKC